MSTYFCPCSDYSTAPSNQNMPNTGLLSKQQLSDVFLLQLNIVLLKHLFLPYPNAALCARRNSDFLSTEACALSAPSISVKASHYKVLLPQSTTDYFLIYRSQHTHTIIQAASEPVDIPQPRGEKKKKIDFLQLSGRGEEVLCASHGWLCCQPE